MGERQSGNEQLQQQALDLLGAGRDLTDDDRAAIATFRAGRQPSLEADPPIQAEIDSARRSLAADPLLQRELEETALDLLALPPSEGELSVKGLAYVELAAEGSSRVREALDTHERRAEIQSFIRSELAAEPPMRQDPPATGAVARALGVLADFPGIASVRAVAEKAVCHWSTLYDSTRFMEAWDAAEASRQSHPRPGFKGTDGGVDAID